MGVDYSTVAGYGFTVTADQIEKVFKETVWPTLGHSDDDYEFYPEDSLEDVLKHINNWLLKEYGDDFDGTKYRVGYFSAGSYYDNTEMKYVITAKGYVVEEYTQKYLTAISFDEVEETTPMLYEAQAFFDTKEPLAFYVGLLVH